jgi:hypothetical protein
MHVISRFKNSLEGYLDHFCHSKQSYYLSNAFKKIDSLQYPPSGPLFFVVNRVQIAALPCIAFLSDSLSHIGKMARRIYLLEGAGSYHELKESATSLKLLLVTLGLFPFYLKNPSPLFSLIAAKTMSSGVTEGYRLTEKELIEELDQWIADKGSEGEKEEAKNRILNVYRYKKKSLNLS